MKTDIEAASELLEELGRILSRMPGQLVALAARDATKMAGVLRRTDEAKLVDALSRLHCGALCFGSSDFNPDEWRRDVERAGALLVDASRRKAVKHG